MGEENQIITADQLVLITPRIKGHNPAEMYLKTLKEGSGRDGAEVSLRLITRLFTLGKTDDYLVIDWSAIRFEHAMVLRARLEDYLYLKSKKSITEGEVSDDDLEPLKISTINHALSILRSVLKIAWQLKQMTGDEYQMARTVPNVRGSSKLAGRSVTPGEREAIFKVCEKDKTISGCRDALIFAFGCMLGMRREEIANVKIADINEQTNELKIIGKGRKERTNYLTGNVILAYQDWITIRGKHAGSLFHPINRGKHLNMRVGISPQGIAKIIDSRRKEAGVDKFSPHDLRRSLVSDLIDANIDFSVIAKWVGHANISTTAKYDRRPDERVREASLKIHMYYHRRFPVKG